jgi:multiple sugar transport system ATP-binding protein
LAAISCQDVTKVYADGTKAVDALDLNIADGELMVLVGPSGCGKTTLLRMIAGLEEVSAGSIRIGDRDVTWMPAKSRDIAMVFQNYALYPHMTAYKNIAWGLKLHKTPKAEIARTVQETARMAGISELLQRKPRQLSGGQRQRVAMGRAIARKPKVFLLDEPLSNLDAKLRFQMRAEIARMQRDLAVTTVYVTHDQTEAMTLGDRVAVMRNGQLLQVDRPQVLYEHPTNLFVAGFIGSPTMNLVQATLLSRDGQWLLEIGEFHLAITERELAQQPQLHQYAGRTIAVGIRPEHLEDASLGGFHSDHHRLAAVVENREDTGAETYLYLSLNVPLVVTEDVAELAADVDADAVRQLERQAGGSEAHFIARVDPRTRVAVGERIELAVDPSRLHFFDLGTGRSLGIDVGATPTGG